MLGFLAAATPAAKAGTVTYGDVVRTVGAGGQLRPASEVRLRLGGAAAAQAGQTQSGAASSDQQQSAGSQQTAPNGSTNTSAPASSDPTLSQSGGQVETVDLGDVTGTVCDCGEIPAAATPKGGFPWWPLLGGTLIPFLIPRGDDDTPPDTPGPTPTPPQIPEPMSLLLFGSGLLAVGARARRRRAGKQLEGDTLCATTEEV